MDYHSMKRKELQALCKEHNIPANSTNSVMADKLSELLNEKQKPRARQRTCLKGSVETNDESEPAVSRREAKKVRFSPNNELLEYELLSAKKQEMVKETKNRRKSVAKKVDNVNTVDITDEVVQSPVKLTRSRVQILEKDGVIPVTEKKQSKRGVKNVEKETEANRGRVTRSKENGGGVSLDESTNTVGLTDEVVQIPVKVTRSRVQNLEKDDVILVTEKKQSKRGVKNVEKETEAVKETEANRGRVTRLKEKGAGVSLSESKQSKKVVIGAEKDSESVKENVVTRGRVTRSKAQTLTEDVMVPDLNPEAKKRSSKRVAKDVENVEIPVRATRSRGKTLKDDNCATVSSLQDAKKRTRSDKEVVSEDNQELPKRKLSRTRGVDVANESENLEQGNRKTRSQERKGEDLESQLQVDKRSRQTRSNKAKVEDSKVEIFNERRTTRSKAPLTMESSKVEGPLEHEGKKKVNRRKSVKVKKTEIVGSPNIGTRKTVGRKQTKGQSDKLFMAEHNVTRSRKDVFEDEIRSPKSRKRRGDPIIEDQTVETDFVSPVKDSPKRATRSADKSEVKSVANKKESSLKESALRVGDSSKKKAKLSEKRSQSDSEDHGEKSNTTDYVSPVKESPKRATRSSVKSEVKSVAKKKESSLKVSALRIGDNSNKKAKSSEKRKIDSEEHVEKSNKKGMTPVSKMSNLKPDEKVDKTKLTPTADESGKRVTRSAIRSEIKVVGSSHGKVVRKKATQSAIKEQLTGDSQLFSRTAPGRFTRSGMKPLNETKVLPCSDADTTGVQSEVLKEDKGQNVEHSAKLPPSDSLILETEVAEENVDPTSEIPIVMENFNSVNEGSFNQSTPDASKHATSATPYLIETLFSEKQQSSVEMQNLEDENPLRTTLSDIKETPNADSEENTINIKEASQKSSPFEGSETPYLIKNLFSGEKQSPLNLPKPNCVEETPSETIFSDIKKKLNDALLDGSDVHDYDQKEALNTENSLQKSLNSEVFDKKMVLTKAASTSKGLQTDVRHVSFELSDVKSKSKEIESPLEHSLGIHDASDNDELDEDEGFTQKHVINEAVFEDNKVHGQDKDSVVAEHGDECNKGDSLEQTADGDKSGRRFMRSAIRSDMKAVIKNPSHSAIKGQLAGDSEVFSRTAPGRFTCSGNVASQSATVQPHNDSEVLHNSDADTIAVQSEVSEEDKSQNLEHSTDLPPSDSVFLGTPVVIENVDSVTENSYNQSTPNVSKDAISATPYLIETLFSGKQQSLLEMQNLKDETPSKTILSDFKETPNAALEENTIRIEEASTISSPNAARFEASDTPYLIKNLSSGEQQSPVDLPNSEDETSSDGKKTPIDALFDESHVQDLNQVEAVNMENSVVKSADTEVLEKKMEVTKSASTLKGLQTDVIPEETVVTTEGNNDADINLDSAAYEAGSSAVRNVSFDQSNVKRKSDETEAPLEYSKTEDAHAQNSSVDKHDASGNDELDEDKDENVTPQKRLVNEPVFEDKENDSVTVEYGVETDKVAILNQSTGGVKPIRRLTKSAIRSEINELHRKADMKKSSQSAIKDAKFRPDSVLNTAPGRFTHTGINYHGNAESQLNEEADENKESVVEPEVSKEDKGQKVEHLPVLDSVISATKVLEENEILTSETPFNQSTLNASENEMTATSYGIDSLFSEKQKSPVALQNFEDDTPLRTNLSEIKETLNAESEEKIIHIEESSNKSRSNAAKVETSEPPFLIKNPFSEDETPSKTNSSDVPNQVTDVALNLLKSVFLDLHEKEKTNSEDSIDSASYEAGSSANCHVSFQQSDIKGKSKEVEALLDPCLTEDVKQSINDENNLEDNDVNTTKDDVKDDHINMPKELERCLEPSNDDKALEVPLTPNDDDNEQTEDAELATDNEQTTEEFDELATDDDASSVKNKQRTEEAEASENPITDEKEPPVEDTVSNPPTSIKDEDSNVQEKTQVATTSLDWGNYSFGIDESPKDDQDLIPQNSAQATTSSILESSTPAVDLVNSVTNLDEAFQNMRKENTNANEDLWSESLKQMFATPAPTQSNPVKVNLHWENQNELSRLFNEETPVDATQSPKSEIFGVPDFEDYFGDKKEDGSSDRSAENTHVEFKENASTSGINDFGKKEETQLKESDNLPVDKGDM